VRGGVEERMGKGGVKRERESERERERERQIREESRKRS
jgi:hypothetical protein